MGEWGYLIVLFVGRRFGFVGLLFLVLDHFLLCEAWCHDPHIAI